MSERTNNLSGKERALLKLMEECGELVQIASKRLMYQTTEEHPDGKGPLNERLEAEIADVTAAIAAVFNLWGLDVDRAMERAAKKEQLFEEWFRDDERT